MMYLQDRQNTGHFQHKKSTVIINFNAFFLFFMLPIMVNKDEYISSSIRWKNCWTYWTVLLVRMDSSEEGSSVRSSCSPSANMNTVSYAYDAYVENDFWAQHTTNMCNHCTISENKTCNITSTKCTK